MQTLISRADIAKYRQISKTPNDDKLNEIILDAQMLDLQPLVGEELYNKILTSPDSYNDLLNGNVYEHGGIEYVNYGLKMVLAYFTYARYMMYSSIVDTPYSVVEKLTADSRPVDISQKKHLHIMNREAAFKIWGNVRNYLVRSGHADFNCNGGSSSVLRFTKIQ